MKQELPEARYDEFATWYAERAAAGTWVDATILANIEPLIGAIDGLTILDLCCGEGRFTRRMSALGATVTGVDLSSNLLDIARSSDPDSSITWLQDDARMLHSLEDHRFLGAICLMALMDIAELGSVLHAVRRVVQPGGWFVAVLTHPCFESPAAAWTPDNQRTAPRYLTEGEWYSEHSEGVRARVGAQHRTLSTYLNEALKAGWTLDAMIEPPNLQADNPNPDIPRLLFLRFR